MTRALMTTVAILGVIVIPVLACAEDDMTSLSYISYLERYVRLTTSQGQETMEAVVNMPVLVGDRLDTARGARAELVLADGTLLWVDQYSTVDFDAIAYSRENPSQRTILFLAEGTAAVEIPREALGEQLVRVDSPAGTIFLSGPGLHRLELREGMVKVESHAGLAELPAGAHSSLLRGGQFAWVDGTGVPDARTLRVTYDEFWSWVEDRRRPAPAPRSARHVSAPAHQVRALDTYGEWVYVTSMSSYMWRPRVAMAWTPYSYGRWVWTPVGWTWVAYEPWGWLPYHYGSWHLSSRWGWVWHWDRYWGPAWVHWIYTPGYIGWVPRGYYDWWYWRHYGHRGPSYGPHRPSRWAHTTLDFRGRVRIRDVDLRHWNVVPADRFTASRLDRVRVDSTRLARDLPGDREAYVRSGPLVSREPIREAPERQLSRLMRDRETTRGPTDTADIGRILRREVRPGDDRTAPTRGVRETDIGQVSREARTRFAETPRDTAPVRDRDDRPVAGGERRPTDRPAPAVTRGEQPGVDRRPTDRPAPGVGRTAPEPRAPATRTEPRTDRPPETTRPAPRTETPPARPAPRTETPPARPAPRTESPPTRTETPPTRSEPTTRQPSSPPPSRTEPATRQPSSPPPSRSAPAARQPSPPAARSQPANQPGRRETTAETSTLQRNVPRSAAPAERGLAPSVAGRSMTDARAAPRTEPRLLRTRSTNRNAEPAASRPALSTSRTRQPVSRTQASPSRPAPSTSRPSINPSRPAPTASRPAPTASRPAPAPSRPAPTASRPAPSPPRTSPAASRPAPAPSRPRPSASRPSPGPSRPAPTASRPAPAPSRPAPTASRPSSSSSTTRSAPSPSRSAPAARSAGRSGSGRGR